MTPVQLAEFDRVSALVLTLADAFQLISTRPTFYPHLFEYLYDVANAHSANKHQRVFSEKWYEQMELI